MNRTHSRQRLTQTISRIDGAYAASTIRAYRSNFIKFIDYCNGIQADALPTEPSTVASYIEHLMDEGWRSASVRQAIATIATIHTLNNHPNPTLDAEVKLAIKRMHRKIGRSCRQANAITREILDEMIGSTDNTLRGLRDRALLLVAYDTMCRRSELVSITIDDLDMHKFDRRTNSKSTAIFIAQSKTDQEANGRWLTISDETAYALREWLIASHIVEGKLFRGVNPNNKITDGLDSGQVGRIYKRLALKAGFEKDFIEHISGHSMRVGAAQDLLISGASLPLMMARGRWSKPDTVMRYVEKLGLPI